MVKIRRVGSSLWINIVPSPELSEKFSYQFKHLECNRAFSKNEKKKNIWSIYLSPVGNYPEKIVLEGVEVIRPWQGSWGFVKAHFQDIQLKNRTGNPLTLQLLKDGIQVTFRMSSKCHKIFSIIFDGCSKTGCVKWGKIITDSQVN